jgi:hypothetical protein
MITKTTVDKLAWLNFILEKRAEEEKNMAQTASSKDLQYLHMSRNAAFEWSIDLIDEMFYEEFQLREHVSHEAD